MLDSFVLYLKNVVTSKECFCLQVFAIDSFIHCQVFPCSMHSFHYFRLLISFKFYFPLFLFSVALRVSGALLVFFYSAFSFHSSTLPQQSSTSLLQYTHVILLWTECQWASVTDSESRNDWPSRNNNEKFFSKSNLKTAFTSFPLTSFLPYFSYVFIFLFPPSLCSFFCWQAELDNPVLLYTIIPIY